jgi:hypothetical protein
MQMMSNMPSEQQIATAIEKVLRRSEFGGPVPGPVQNEAADSVGRAFFAGLDSLSGLGSFMIILVAAALIGLLVWLFYSERRYRLGRRSKQSSSEQPTTADPLLDAEALALKQDWAGALLALYASHLQMLQQQGWIVLDESKTGLQYQWELSGRGYEEVKVFADFRKVFNRVRYGGYLELQETYETFLAYCRKVLKRRQAA